jgi:hypothetical protein
MADNLPQKLTIGTTGVSIALNQFPCKKALWRVQYREALAAGTHTAWTKAPGSSVAVNLPVFGETEANPGTLVTVRQVLYGPVLNGDTCGISSSGDQANKEVYWDIVPLS